MKPPKRADENEVAARVVRESTAKADELPTELEAAWADWSRRVQAADDRTMTLLRAAFEAGHAASAASRTSTAADLGRRGGLKGGKARADSFSKQRLREIAKKAAKARWKTS